MRHRGAFTLLEVMVAVAILGLSVAGGLRLFTISIRALEDVRREQRNLSLARSLWLKAAAEKLEDRGREEDFSWETEKFVFERQPDVPEGFSCRKVTLVQGDPMSRPLRGDADAFIFYLPDMKVEKERAE